MEDYVVSRYARCYIGKILNSCFTIFWDFISILFSLQILFFLIDLRISCGGTRFLFGGGGGGVEEESAFPERGGKESKNTKSFLVLARKKKRENAPWPLPRRHWWEFSKQSIPKFVHTDILLGGHHHHLPSAAEQAITRFLHAHQPSASVANTRWMYVI